MSRFKVRYRGAVWDADLLCSPRGVAQAWQIYGYPCDSSVSGSRQHHWVPFAEAAQVVSAQIQVSSPTVQEPGISGETPMVFQVSLTAARPETVTLTYSTAPATATPVLDFTPVTGTLVFAPGETTKNVTVMVKGDTVSPEPAEAVALEVSEPTTGDPPVTGYGTIQDYPWTPNEGFTYSPLRYLYEEFIDRFEDFIPKLFRS